MHSWNSSRRILLARSALVPVAALSVARLAEAADAPASARRSTNIALILAFCKAGQARDVEGQMRFIAEDGIYHNMPDAPIVGATGIRALLTGYLTGSDATEIIVHNIAEARPGVVLTERLDRFRAKGKWIDCPVMGSARIENGRIQEWRDYYDNAYLARQMS